MAENSPEVEEPVLDFVPGHQTDSLLGDKLVSPGHQTVSLLGDELDTMVTGAVRVRIGIKALVVVLGLTAASLIFQGA